MAEPIDFVVTWVDGNDPEWFAEKQKHEVYRNKDVEKDNGIERYRDWGLFRYWFRAVENFAPWVNKVYLVTCGHIPSWINENHPKLVIVNHKDFMDEDYLPTFNCNPIENNLHKIAGLNEHFVYFNDDMFFTQPVKPEDFFQDGKPLVCSVATPVQNDPANSAFNHMIFSDIGLVNCYDWEAIVEKRPEKWFSHCNGIRLMYNWHTYQQRFLTGVYFTHMPQAFRKSTFVKMWDIFGKELDETCRHRFRTPLDLTHFVFTLQEIADCDYVPLSPFYYGQINGNNFVQMHENPRVFADYIRSQRFKAICVNDSEEITNVNYEGINACIHKAFEEILPTPSLYEK